MRLLLALLFAGPALAAFDENLSRNVFMPIAAAAYSDVPQECIARILDGQVSKQVTMKIEFFRDNGSGFTFFSESHKVIGLSFRGTSDTLQLVTEFTDTAFESKVEFDNSGKAAYYFSDAFHKLWDGGLGEDLQVLMQKYPDYTLYITGHSLGAALASLATTHVAATGLFPENQIIMYNFGQPRTGDKTYAADHDVLMTESYRVVHARDIVTHVPPEMMKYVHHKYEVFYKNDMKPGDAYIICTEEEDKKCSDQYTFDTSVEDHTHYYQKHVSDFGKKGCTD